MTATLVADLGGTRLKVSRLGAPELVFDHGGDWQGALREALDRLGGQALALCVPGLVEAGRVISLPGKLPGIVGADLSSLLGVPVLMVVNDAVAYAVGEATAGAGRGASRVVAVTIGTGVGVGVVEDGRPLGRGPLGAGVLGGALPLPGPVDGPLDSAGRAGTFEARCQVASLVASVPGAVDAESAYALVRTADPAAVQGFCDYRRWLIRGLAALCAAHAPDVVVVGAARPARDCSTVCRTRCGQRCGRASRSMCGRRSWVTPPRWRVSQRCFVRRWRYDHRPHLHLRQAPGGAGRDG